MAGALETIMIIAEYAMLGQQLINVFQALSPSSVPDEEVVEDLAEQVDLAFQEVQAYMANDLSYTSLTLKNVNDNTLLGEVDWPTLTVGGNSGSILPFGVAGLVTFPTATPKVRGRKFIPGLCETELVDGVWDSNLVPALEAFAALIVTPFVGGTSGEIWTFGVNDQLDVFRPFTAAIVPTIPAYQRRRKQGVGS